MASVDLRPHRHKRASTSGRDPSCRGPSAGPKLECTWGPVHALRPTTSRARSNLRCQNQINQLNRNRFGVTIFSNGPVRCTSVDSFVFTLIRFKVDVMQERSFYLNLSYRPDNFVTSTSGMKTNDWPLLWQDIHLVEVVSVISLPIR